MTTKMRVESIYSVVLLTTAICLQPTINTTTTSQFTTAKPEQQLTPATTQLRVYTFSSIRERRFSVRCVVYSIGQRRVASRVYFCAEKLGVQTTDRIVETPWSDKGVYILVYIGTAAESVKSVSGGLRSS